MSDTENERIKSLERAILRMEMEIEVYRQLAIQEYHESHAHSDWEKSTDRVDQEAYERLRRQGVRL